MTMQQNFAMTPSVKNAISKVLRFILLPLGYNYRKRNGMKHALSPKREIPNDVLLGAVRETINQGHTATIIVKGWSMRPFLEHLRDKVQLDSPKCIQKYDAVLAEISSGKYVLHRIINIQPHPSDTDLDQITLMGDGNIRGTEQCLRKDVCGVVTHYIRPNRTILANSPSLIKNIRMWHSLLPIRKYLLFIYKAII